ncbi:ankyrin [Beauveria brongniartii RCEF 3172]|uniref:Ankyrin n=1 Tax=Beauveria brongniartii RCEF 3172 TaxID=1081107 RepID=A0A167FZC9_9HYPO|nr:ankyrin [Beauveria brongniartii RCEF 3172]
MDLNAADDVSLQDDKGLTIYQHALQCTKEFQKYKTVWEEEFAVYPTMEQTTGFFPWTSDMGVFLRCHKSLDYRLRYSPKEVANLHQLLDIILKTLMFGKSHPRPERASLAGVRMPVTPSHKSAKTPKMRKRRTSEAGRAHVTRTFDYSSETDSKGDEGVQGKSSVSLITNSIHETVRPLRLLSQKALRSSLTARADAISSYEVDESTNNAMKELRLSTEDYIRSQFPRAPKTLCSALVEASVLRFRHLCYEREHEDNKTFRGKCDHVTFILEHQKSLRLEDRHLRDLEPFVCVIDHCTDSGVLEPCTLTFGTSRAWLSHMEDTHGNVSVCDSPSHLPISFQKKAEIQEFRRTWHNAPGLAGCASYLVQRTGLQKITECPFGDDFAAPEDIESDLVFSSDPLRRHVATHMKDISLLALHKLASLDADKSEDTAHRPAVRSADDEVTKSKRVLHHR